MIRLQQLQRLRRATKGAIAYNEKVDSFVDLAEYELREEPMASTSGIGPVF